MELAEVTILSNHIFFYLPTQNTIYLNIIYNTELYNSKENIILKILVF